MGGRLISAILLFLTAALVQVGPALAASETLSLTLPHLDWAMTVPAPGFALEDKYALPDGKRAQFMATNRRTGFSLSGSLEKAPRAGSAKECRDYYWQNLQKGPFKMSNVRMSEAGEVAVIDYVIREHQGMPINQKNLYAYLARGEYWMYVHVSKGAFKPDDEASFKAVAESARILSRNSERHWDATYRVSDRHSLTLKVPQTWADQVERPENDMPPTITLVPGNGAPAKVMVTPIWSPAGRTDFNKPESIRNLLEDGGRKLLPQAVEKELVLRQLNAARGSGYYYFLTDKAPKPGEFKYMNQGGMGIGELLVMFTILTHEKDSPVTQEALRMITGARP